MELISLFLPHICFQYKSAKIFKSESTKMISI